jgi:hypothetical protein
MIDAAALRRLVREVIAAELDAARGSPATETARIADDADLAAFARRVLALAEDATARQAIAAGRYPFELAHGSAPATPSPPARLTGAAAARIDTGVVTEASLAKLPKGAARLVIGDGVAVTPLARDRARKLGITIERSKP